MLRCNGHTLSGKTIAVSGAGNVATYAIEKRSSWGAQVVTCSDSTGWIYDPEGIDVALLKDVKEVRRAGSPSMPRPAPAPCITKAVGSGL